jgi:transposase
VALSSSVVQPRNTLAFREYWSVFYVLLRHNLDLARTDESSDILVWDRLSGHVRSRKTLAFLAENAGWLSVEPLPGYAPELDPVEQAWAWIKNGPLARYCAPTLAALTDAAGRALETLRRRPELFTAFLRHAGLDWPRTPHQPIITTH